jgi:hypothetical protein
MPRYQNTIFGLRVGRSFFAPSWNRQPKTGELVLQVNSIRPSKDEIGTENLVAEMSVPNEGSLL